MKKLWSIILLIGLVNKQMLEPTMVGQEKLQVPTLSINIDEKLRIRSLVFS